MSNAPPSPRTLTSGGRSDGREPSPSHRPAVPPAAGGAAGDASPRLRQFRAPTTLEIRASGPLQPQPSRPDAGGEVCRLRPRRLGGPGGDQLRRSGLRAVAEGGAGGRRAGRRDRPHRQLVLLSEQQRQPYHVDAGGRLPLRHGQVLTLRGPHQASGRPEREAGRERGDGLAQPRAQAGGGRAVPGPPSRPASPPNRHGPPTLGEWRLMPMHRVMPFTALIGQEPMKTALILNAVNPAIGGVLIRGERGTAKSTAVRALAGLLPAIDVVAGCRFSCSPLIGDLLCDECHARQLTGEHLALISRPMRVVDLPINASEDRLVGSIDIERAIKEGERSFDPGILAEANRNILYVDEVNLLDDHLVDVLLDAAAMGVNTVEREGISMAHPARFILIGTMNPEEGELRPQLLDRFGLCVDVSGLRSVAARVAVMQTDMERQHDAPRQHRSSHADEERLRAVIVKAQELVPLVEISTEMRWFTALACMDAGVMGHRADIVVSRTAQSLCALREAEAVIN